MNIPPITPLSFNETLNTMEITKTPAAPFSHWLTDAVNQTNDHLVLADKALEELASGQSTSLHHTMLTMEEAKLSFQFLEQVRNRLMGAYQELLREQI